MNYHNLTLLAVCVLVYSLTVKRFESRLINGPLAFLLFGVITGPVLGLLHPNFDREWIKALAEITLALVLFNDAALANTGVLSRYRAIPIRLLAISLPLCILLGTVIGVWLLDLPVLIAALLATMLAPTDAALGKAVVSNVAVPEQVREGLNAESGLNDGICVPILFLFLILAGAEQGHLPVGELIVHLVVHEVGIGLAVGLIIPYVAVKFIEQTAAAGFHSSTWDRLTLLALAIVCFGLAQALGGSGFISAFIGGITFSQVYKQDAHQYIESAEGFSELLSVITWVTFGAVVLPMTLEGISPLIVIYAVLSLTVIRMVPVALAFIGSGVSARLVLFIAWFGPRGLASIVFAVIVGADDLPHIELLTTTVACTVLLSVVFHGLSANPLVKRISRQ